MGFRYIDLFAGMGGIRLGLEQVLKERGIEGECVLTSEIKPYALDVYKQNFGEENIVGDISKVESESIPDFDMLLGGFPCFVGSSLVRTYDGYKEIKDIVKGDKVLTHDGSYREVLNSKNQGIKDIVRIKGVGTDMIHTTMNHQFLVKDSFYSEPQWKSVSQIKDNVDKYKMVLPMNKESKLPKFDDGVKYNRRKIWSFLGAIFNLGHMSNGKYKMEMSKDCFKQFELRVPRKVNYDVSEVEDSYIVTIMTDWVNERIQDFGSYSTERYLPQYVLDLPIKYLEEFMDSFMYFNTFDEGQIIYDNHKDYSRLCLKVYSKCLAYDIGTCILKCYRKPYSIEIDEGEDLPFYTSCPCTIICDMHNKSYDVRDKYYYFPIEYVEELGFTDEVYDIEVEENHSFICENCIVHNCQPFSAAGCQRGFEDTRGTLFFEVARILRDKKPKYFLLENVENLVIHDLSKEDKKKGKKIGKTLETILKVLEGLGYHVSWKVLQASDYGVPQLRRRIYIVGSLEDKISLDDFEKSEKNFGEIQERGVKVEDSEFNRCVKDYLNKNHKDYSYLYGKAFRNKRGSSNNIHGWDLGIRGEVNEAQREMLEKMVTERRRNDLAREKGVPLKDGVGLTKDELRGIYKGQNFEEDFVNLLQNKYIKSKSIENYSNLVYDIIGGNLSYEFSRVLDPNSPCITLVATESSKLGVYDKTGIRKLTLKEALRLNGYPEDYKFDIDYRKGMDLCGNTVVVPVIKMICERIIK